MIFERKPKVFFLAAFLSAWIIFTVIGIIRTEAGSNDFDTFYAAGKAVLTGSGIYYSGDYYEVSNNLGPFLYPPVAACFFALFALFPVPVAVAFWTALLILVFGLGVCLSLIFLKIPPREFPSYLKLIPSGQRYLLLGMSALFLIDNLVMLQINILVFFLACFCLVLWQRGRPLSAGLVLSAAIFLKLTPVLFCLYFLIKKSWKVLIGVFVGGILLAVLIPVLFFGLEGSRVYHQQWFGRMIKPSIIDLIEKVKPTEFHPLKKSVSELIDIATSQKLIDTNQSLSAALTRLFLKDRGRHQVAYRYANLPVIAGGVSGKTLNILIALLQFLLLGGCIYFWSRGDKRGSVLKTSLDVSLIFLSLTLLSPITRSHYYVVWVFVYLNLLSLRRQPPGFSTKLFTWSAHLSAVFYLLLAVPYGEALGAGAWANLIFWAGCVHQLKIVSKSA